MASTRSKNTPGNYDLEQHDMFKMRKYELYQGHVFNDQTCLPGRGLLPARLPTQLFEDNCDIESELRGIGATNLVDPKTNSLLPPAARPMPTLNVIDTAAVILPQPLVVPKNYRFDMS
jgi:hypothetical protein